MSSEIIGTKFKYTVLTLTPFSSHHLCTVSPLLFCAWIWADHSVRRNSFFTVANVVFIIFISTSNLVYRAALVLSISLDTFYSNKDYATRKI